VNPPAKRPARQHDAAELAQLEIGTQLKDFLGTAAGQWLKARLSEGQNAIAKEALLNPAKEFTTDYYRGRATELSSLATDIEAQVKAAAELMGEEEGDDPFDAYDGPQIGGGTPALGDFGR
jgi:hypothetical protein